MTVYLKIFYLVILLGIVYYAGTLAGKKSIEKQKEDLKEK